MRHLIFLGILGIVLISLCTQTDVSQAGFGTTEVTGSPDIYLKFSALPEEVKSGRNITITYSVQNKQPFDLENISLDAYDLCLFSGQQNAFDALSLKANKTKQTSLKYMASSTNFERDCTIKFKTEYESEYRLQQDVVVLAESEYYVREQQGTLSDIVIRSSSSSNPVSVALTFSEKQPFLSGDSFNMYIDYSNSGDGYISKLELGSVVMRIPNNLELTPDSSPSEVTLPCESFSETECETHEGCSLKTDYCTGVSKLGEDCAGLGLPMSTCSRIGCTWDTSSTYRYCIGTSKVNDKKTYCSGAFYYDDSTQEVILNRVLSFIDNKAPKTTCKVTTVATQLMDSKSLFLTAKYKYVLDNSIIVKVRPS